MIKNYRCGDSNLLFPLEIEAGRTQVPGQPGPYGESFSQKHM
jgi:hypothetical protein